MSVLILMPEYCIYVDLDNGIEEVQTLTLPTEFLQIDRFLIKQVVDEILASLGIF